MSTYNGHKNWNRWNVSLWINDDEGLYRLAMHYARRYTRKEAAQLMLNDLEEMGVTKTPDGAPYSISSIRAAMVGM